MTRAGAAATLLALVLLASRATAMPGTTYAQVASSATTSLLRVYATGDGRWRLCDAPDCPATSGDWGADSLTDVLFLRWRATHDPTLVAALRTFVSTADRYAAPCNPAQCDSWSDKPEWDAIAAVREWQATGDPAALATAESAYAFVRNGAPFDGGACPGIPYQQAGGGSNRLKTLETSANAVKAALLLFAATGDRSYLADAVRLYAQIRVRFLDPRLPLYSVYVFDDGRRCVQLPHRFFASVNGDMIWNGLMLARATGRRGYLRQALATGHAVDADLADPAGIFADLQAENDVVEPLVEAMLALATDTHATFARAWILLNAAAAVSARAADGAFGRFFDGPPPRTTVTAWQTAGGSALEIAAAELDPRGRVPAGSGWAGAKLVNQAIAGAPASIRFTGRGIALLGTLGQPCCEPGHVRVLVDGRETVDATGIWQGKSSSCRAIPGSILFAWRWPTSGTHTVTLEPGVPNPKEGGSAVELSGYLLMPGR
jgi:hypothetical protein